MTSPVVGFTSAEIFPGNLTFGVFIRRFVPMLVMMIAVVVLGLGVILSGLGVNPPVAFLVGAVLSAALAIVLMAGKKRQFDQTWGTSRLELSPRGATVISRYARIHLPWDHIRHLGPADLLTLRRSTGGGIGLGLRLAMTIGALLADAMAATARRRGQAALVGDGVTIIEPGTPNMIRAQIAQNNGCRDFDLRTGYRYTAIVLPVFDENWARGRIGAWISAYRPDLIR